MRLLHIRFVVLVIAATFILAAGQGSRLSAAVFTWSGAGTPNNTWDLTAQNWTSGGATAWVNNVDRTTPNTATFAVAAATLTVGDNIDVGSVTFTSTGWTLNAGTGALAFGGTGTLVLSAAGQANFINAAIVDGASFGTGGGVTSLAQTGAGSVVLGGTNTYSGSTSVSAGILQIQSDAALGTGSGSGNIVLSNSGSLRGGSSFTLNANRGITLGGSAGDSGTLDGFIADTTMIYDGVIADSAFGGNKLIKGAGQGNVQLGGSNTYTGTTTLLGTVPAITVAGGVRNALIVTANNALGTGDNTATTGTILGANAGVLAFKGGVQYTTTELLTVTGNANNVNGSLRSLTGDNLFAGNVSLGANALTIGTDTGSSLKLTGLISGTGGSLNKIGAGSLTLTQANTYSGATTIAVSGALALNRAGVLKLEGAASLPNSAVTIGDSGTLLIDSTSSGVVATSRVPQGITLINGGILQVNGNNANDTTDSFGTPNLNIGSGAGSGENFVVINPGIERTSRLNFGGLNRFTSVNNFATVTFKGPNFGAATGSSVGTGTGVSQVFFTTAPSLVTLNAAPGYLPYAVVTDTATGVSNLATYNATDGLRGLKASEYNSSAAVNGLSAANARLTASTAVTGDTASQSLTLQGNNITLNGTGNVRIGRTAAGAFVAVGLLSQGTGNLIDATSLSFGGGTAGANNVMIYVDGDLTINSTITNGSSTTNLATSTTTGTSGTGIIKTGSGNLILSGTNTFSTANSGGGATFRIENGMVTFGSAANLGASTNVINMYAGSTLHLTAGKTVTFAGAIQAGGASDGAVDPTRIAIQVDTGSTFTITGVGVQGANKPSGFTKTGAGTLVITGNAANNDAQGNSISYLSEGTLRFTTAGRLQNNGMLAAGPGTNIHYDSTASNTSAQRHNGLLSLASATLAIDGNAANDTFDEARILVLEAGASWMTITPGANRISRMHFVNPADRTIRNPGSTIVFRGPNLGSAGTANVARVTFASAQDLSGGILPYALTDDSTSGSGTSFATIATVAASNTIVANNVNLTSSIATSNTGNVVLTGDDLAGGTVNSLTMNGSGLVAGSGTLNVTSGGVLNTGGGNSIAATTLAFGAAEGIIHAVSNLDVSSQITGTAGLTKAGPGTLTLSAANNYSGTTHVNNGVLRVNGSLGANSPVSVNYGGTLGGTGTVAGAVTVQSGGTIAPGAGEGNLGTGSLTLTKGSRYSADIDMAGESADQILVSGSVVLGGTLELNVTNLTAGTGQTFVLIANDGTDAITGAFDLIVPTSLSPNLVYSTSLTGGTGNDFTVTITAVPEPTALSLVLLGAGLLRRRRGIVA